MEDSVSRVCLNNLFLRIRSTFFINISAVTAMFLKVWLIRLDSPSKYF